jgi:hypothetical protein
MKKIESTRSKILKYLQDGNTLDSLKAFKLFGTLSLQQHINVLRNRGNAIFTTMETNKKTGVRFAQYANTFKY